LSAWLYLLQQTLNALQVASIYALLALGYVLVHGVTHRVNLAFGALAMWSGYLGVVGATGLSALFFLEAGAALVLALPLVLAAVFATAFLFARSVVLPLAHRPGLAMLVATIGVAIVIEEAARLGSGGRDLWLSPILADPAFELGEGVARVRVTGMQIVMIGGAACLVLATLAALERTRAGRLWRAVSDDPRMAALLGVRVARVVLLSALAGATLAGAAGLLATAYYGNASFHLGLILGLKTLYVAVLGGLSSPYGALLGGVALGFFETFWSAFLPIAWRDAASFSALTLLLALRPSGLASREAERV